MANDIWRIIHSYLVGTLVRREDGHVHSYSTLLGRKNGIFISYSRKGTIISLGFLWNDKIKGLIIHYNDYKYESRVIINDMREEANIAYDVDHIIQRICFYHQDKLEGIARHYSNNRQIDLHYHHGEIIDYGGNSRIFI